MLTEVFLNGLKWCVCYGWGWGAGVVHGRAALSLVTLLVSEVPVMENVCQAPLPCVSDAVQTPHQDPSGPIRTQQALRRAGWGWGSPNPSSRFTSSFQTLPLTVLHLLACFSFRSRQCVSVG
uniref:Uncharacterized protein n=1 Tax=Salarias fasciatus TaxID=181472 RepID=A0A672FG28_SALFA